jgi:hypothetical protein
VCLLQRLSRRPFEESHAEFSSHAQHYVVPKLGISMLWFVAPLAKGIHYHSAISKKPGRLNFLETNFRGCSCRVIAG